MQQAIRFGVALAWVAAGALVCSAADRASQDLRVRGILEPLQQKHEVPALGAAVVRTTGLAAVAVVGVRKHGADVAATVDDRFHIGSDTKAMTAALVARLVEAGKLHWDDTLAKSFPELAESMHADQKGITLDQWLTHRSGLPANVEGLGGWWQFSRIDGVRRQRLEVVKKAATLELKSKPGEKFLYSNLGYVLAAAMAEKAADAAWEDLLRKQLFEPLGMHSAGFGPPGSADKIDQPWPHNAAGKPRTPDVRADNPAVIGPAGSVHCSLPDWAKYVGDQLRGARGLPALLRPETYRRLHAAPGSPPPYTLGGWGRAGKAGDFMLFHDGSNTFNYASAVIYPGKDLAVLVVCNRGGEAGSKACQEARAALVKAFDSKP